MIRLLRKPKRVQAQSRAVHAVVRRFIPHLPVSKCTGTSKPCQSRTPTPSPPSHPTGFLMAACLNPNMATYCSQKGRGGGGLPYHRVCRGWGGSEGDRVTWRCRPRPRRTQVYLLAPSPPSHQRTESQSSLYMYCRRVMAMVGGARPSFFAAQLQ
jgi:hypothetical protein